MEISQNIKNCQLCDCNNLELILDLGSQPPANSLRQDIKNNLPNVDLKLLFCTKCSLLQLSEIVDPKYLFDNYLWVSGTSKGTRKYSKIFSEIIITKLKDLNIKPQYILELASNDGTFLQEFMNNNLKVLGVDPAKNIAEIANKNGVKTIANFFDISLAHDILQDYGHPSVIIARNVIPHVKEIKSIIEGISILLEGNNIGVIEFHYSKIILEELHYDSIYHEHIFYFSLHTIEKLLLSFNLYIYDCEQSPISGGSLVIFISKSKNIKSKKLINTEINEKKLKINLLETWNTFAKNTIKHSDKLNKLILTQKNKGLVVGFGASARSSTILNFCGINNTHLDFIIDNNKLKKDMITPGSNIKIISLKDSNQFLNKISCIIILAWNFEEEIREELINVGYKGYIIVPLPNEPKLYEI